MCANATDSLPCTGVQFDVLFHVGNDGGDIIGDLTLYKNTSNTIVHQTGSFDFSCISWPESEVNFHKNNLKVVATTNDFETIQVFVTGNTGRLFFNDKEYSLKCNWQR